MIILKENQRFRLMWQYSIKNNKTIKKDKEYYFYNVVFPAELVEYYNNSEYIWMYRREGKTYISKEEPPYAQSKRFKLFNKGNPQKAKDFTLSKKFFKELEGHVNGTVQYIFHMDERDPLMNQRGMLEIQIKLGGRL